MLRTWLRRLLGIPRDGAAPTAPPTPLEIRLDALEEHVDWLHGALRRLRGRVTGGLRNDPDPAGENGGPVSDAPPVQSTGFDRQYELSKLSHARDEAYARQIKGDR